MANVFGEMLTGSFGGHLVMDMTFAINFLTRAEPKLRFLNFVNRADFPGERPGKIVTVPIIGTTDESATTALTEGTTMSIRRLTTATSGITLNEYGDPFGWTGKLNVLSYYEIDPIVRTKLEDSYALTQNALARNQYFGAATTGTFISVAQGPTTTPTGTYPSGTGIGTPTDELTYNVIEHAVDALAGRNAAKFSHVAGGTYVGSFSSKGLRGLKHDPNWINAVTYGDSRRLYRGEVGEFAGIRFVEDETIPTVTQGDASTIQRGILLGRDAVGWAVAQEMELRPEFDYGQDFGRQHALAWYAVQGFGILIKEYVQAVYCMAGKYTVS